MLKITDIAHSTPRHNSTNKLQIPLNAFSELVESFKNDF